MARIKDPQETNLKKCAFSKCGKEFKPEFIDQIYCNPKCRNRAGVLRHIEKVIPEHLMGLSNDELTHLLADRVGIRSYDRRKRFMIPERVRRQKRVSI